jgi:hypothetical protein
LLGFPCETLADHIMAELEQLEADERQRQDQPAVPYGDGWDKLPSVQPGRNGHARLPGPPDGGADESGGGPPRWICRRAGATPSA